MGVDLLERELAVLTRRIEATGRSSDLYRPMDRSGYLIASSIDAEGRATVGDLAMRLGLDGSTVTRQLDALESRGYVERQPDPRDGRARVVALTTSGRRAMRSVRSARKERIDAALAGWSNADIQTFARLLERFNESLGPRVEGQ